MKTILLIALFFLVVAPVFAQETVITESAYHVVPAYGQKYKVMFAVVAINPFEDKFASAPTIRLTARAQGGSILGTQEFGSGGIPPKGRIAFCKEMYVDEIPGRVDIRPLDAHYETTRFRPAQFLPFELINVVGKTSFGNKVKVTGEIKNPYLGETGVWITILYRDAQGKLLGGVTNWESTVPAGEPTPFEIYVDPGDIPPGTKTTESGAFSHNNYQTSWDKLLRN
jgi:hypothetical protein